MLFKELYEIIETPKCEIIEKTKNGEKIYTDKDSENYEIIKTLFNKEVQNVWVSDEIPGYTIITLKEKIKRGWQDLFLMIYYV